MQDEVISWMWEQSHSRRPCTDVRQAPEQCQAALAQPVTSSLTKPSFRFLPTSRIPPFPGLPVPQHQLSHMPGSGTASTASGTAQLHMVPNTAQTGTGQETQSFELMFANPRVGWQVPGLALLQTLPEQLRDEALTGWPWPGWRGQNKGCHCCQQHPDPPTHTLWMATQSLALVTQNQHLCPYSKHTLDVALRLTGTTN